MSRHVPAAATAIAFAAASTLGASYVTASPAYSDNIMLSVQQDTNPDHPGRLAIYQTGVESPVDDNILPRDVTTHVALRANGIGWQIASAIVVPDLPSLGIHAAIVYILVPPQRVPSFELAGKSTPAGPGVGAPSVITGTITPR